MKLKMKNFKNTPIKNYEREKHILYIFLNLLIIPEELLLYEAVFENLKWKLVNIPILAFPNFNKSFILYVDDNKKRGYKIILYYISADDIERPILYISKNFTPAEQRY
jgi:hypothetical protein